MATTATTSYRKRPGLEVLPGYRLIEPLGRGGFGEVWKCEAPGGLHKAVKFVADDNDPDDAQAEASLRQEYEAFERVKRIRHPFLLTLERVELIPGDLVMVMELADYQLQDYFDDCRKRGLPGIPREELLVHLSDAAEVLDHLMTRHQLQHLDIKPANLFLVSGRVKVGDFGLVRRHELHAASPGVDRGLTPKYVAPEILHGRVDPRSDQYCLALVYQEMLTGVFPYSATTPRQMMLQHVATAPDLGPLPIPDRGAVARALSKAPTDRFGTCREFVQALRDAGVQSVQETWNGRSHLSPTHAELSLSRRPQTGSSQSMTRPPGLDPAQLTGRFSQPTGTGAGGMPRLTTQRRPAAVAPPPGPVSEPVELVALAAPAIRLEVIHSIVPRQSLTRPDAAPVRAPKAVEVIHLMVAALAPDGVVPAVAGGVTRRPDGSHRARVPVRPLPGTARIRINVMQELWQAEVEERGPDHFVVRRPHQQGGLWGRMSSKKSGLEVELVFPPPGPPVGEAVLTGRTYGDPDPGLAKAAEQLLPKMLDEARLALQTTDERRASVRVPARTPVELYPVHSDGRIDPALHGTTQDVSTGGVGLETDLALDTAYGYLVFPELATVNQWGLLLRLVRAHPTPTGIELAGRFRTDL